MLKLKDGNDGSTFVTSMLDGDIAVITNWSVSNYVGRIVQRYGDSLITLGEDSGWGWGEYFKNVKSDSQCRVRILEKGETLEVN